MDLESVKHLSIYQWIQKNMKFSMRDFKCNWIPIHHRESELIFIGVQINPESNFQDRFVLNDDNFFYTFDAAKLFILHFVHPGFYLYLTTHVIKGNSIETSIICEKKHFPIKSSLILEISEICKIFHELTDEQLFELESQYLILILKQNHKFECNEFKILENVLKWMINYEEKSTKGINLRLIIMDIIHCIRLDEITEEDFNKLPLTIDVYSDVYDTFQKVFHSMKFDEKPNEFADMIKPYGFPTSRGVHKALVQFEKSDSLKIVCSIPMSKTSPKWEKVYNINVGGCVKEKWSVVYENNLFVFGSAIRFQTFGFKYCPPLDEWIKVRELKHGYKLTSLNAVGNYFIGIGTVYGKTKKFAMKYDPVLNVWSKIKKMPVLLHQYAAVAFDDTLLISGGKKRRNSESSRDFWMYSLSSNVWTKLPNMNYGRSNHVMLRNKSKIYFIRDTAGSDEPSKQVECYDMISQTFQVITNVLETSFSDNQVVFNNKFFIANEQKLRTSHSLEIDAYKLIWGSFCNIDIQKLMFDTIYIYKTK